MALSLKCTICSLWYRCVCRKLSWQHMAYVSLVENWLHAKSHSWADIQDIQPTLLRGIESSCPHFHHTVVRVTHLVNSNRFLTTKPFYKGPIVGTLCEKIRNHYISCSYKKLPQLSSQDGRCSTWSYGLRAVTVRNGLKTFIRKRWVVPVGQCVEQRSTGALPLSNGCFEKNNSEPEFSVATKLYMFIISTGYL